VTITTLTAEQWAAVAAAREDWRSVGLCTEPADRATTERLISRFYARLGKPPPRFIWLDGPAACCYLGPLLVRAAQLYDQLRAQLDSQLDSQLRAQLGAQLGAQLRAQLYDQMRHQLGAQLYDRLRAQLDALGDQLNELPRQMWRLREWGSENCGWVAWYTTVRDICGVTYSADQSALLDEWATLMRAGGWWLPAETVCFCAERHRTVRFDAERRLHCADGPAIECRDGFRVYAWHGTRIPAAWIEQRETLAAETALTWPNIEQRRAAAEILGWSRILAALPTRTIDRDPDPQVGELLHVDLPDAPGSAFLRVRCGTGREFILPVPAECRTALEANAWTYDISPNVYRNLRATSCSAASSGSPTALSPRPVTGRWSWRTRRRAITTRSTTPGSCGSSQPTRWSATWRSTPPTRT
jgi:hypothetical protein